MKTVFLAVIVFLASLTLSVAQPSFNPAAKKVGDVTRWQADNGKTSVTYRGREGALLVLDFRRDASRGQPLSLRVWTNARGEAVKVRYNGRITTYSPSDCSLTVGRCTYVETDANGGRKNMTWRAEVKGGFWHYTLFEGNTLAEEGTFSVDKFGYNIDRDYISYQNGKGRRQWSRRLR